MAFIVLISLLISDQQDLSVILSQTLNQAVDFSNACGGDIWLLSEDGQFLDLASSLFVMPYSSQRVTRRRKEQGVIGWANQCNTPLVVASLAEDTHFDPLTDQFGAEIPNFRLLAI